MCTSDAPFSTANFSRLLNSIMALEVSFCHCSSRGAEWLVARGLTFDQPADLQHRIQTMTTSPNQIQIRPATPADVPLILSLVRELAEYERALDQVVATEETLHRHMFGNGWGRGPVAEALIGEIAGRPEGFALYFSNFSTWLATSGI